MKWTDIWHRPFNYDGSGYIWDRDCVMVFTVDDLTEENYPQMDAFCRNIVTALNGDGQVQKYPNLHIEDECDIYQGDQCIGCFRGWGHLTGGLKLPEEKAAGLQDEMIRYVMDKIS